LAQIEPILENSAAPALPPSRFDMENQMRKLTLAAAAMLGAACFSGNAFALTGSYANGVKVSNSAVKASCCYGPAYRCYYARPYYATPCGYNACGGGYSYGGGWFFGLF
jgi:hypothetical protein